ncbi:hypothetical protein [Croceicoccus bisphenolivorans]|uniref:hypothetical protein n=1 Tax=Croceicoccus bisphenolivorans TaxID=1783232 RepID=UPI0008350900|nr:hypothetical protein [Croceicoccus bisphenolivorans]
MANRWLFVGGDVGTVRNSASDTITTSTYFDSAYSDCAIFCGDAGDSFIADFIDSSGSSDAATAGETLFVHVYWVEMQTATTAGNAVWSLLNGSDQPWLSIRTTSTAGVYGFYYNSNTGASPTWTLIGSTFTKASVGNAFDIKLTLGSPHDVELYTDAVLLRSTTFSNANLTSIDACKGERPTGADQAFSQIMASVGINTIGGHVYTKRPEGAGSNSGMTGAYTDIDEVGINDADILSSGTSGQRSTFAYADLGSLPSGYAVGDVFLWTRAKNDGAAPANIKPVRRDSGSTDNVGSALSGIGTGFVNLPTRYSGLTITEFNASEFGVESST